MNQNHVPFEKLSECMDGELPLEEKEAIFAHLDSCPECSVEYHQLKGMLDLCTELQSVPVPYHGLDSKVIKKIKFRRTKKKILRYAPAVAASLLLIIAFAIYEGRNSSQQEITQAPQDGQTQANTSGSSQDIEAVINILRDHNATILNVSDLYVDGKIPLSQFDQLRRNLGFRNVSFTVIDQDQNTMPSNIEEVDSNGGFTDDQGMYRGIDGGKIHPL